MDEHVEKKCVQDMIEDIPKLRKRIDAKSRELHQRAEEMIRDGNEKAREIHKGAEEMTAEGEKRMSAGIQAVH